MLRRRKRKHHEVVESIERLQRENDALDRQIEFAAAPPPPKKRADWERGRRAVVLPSREQMILRRQVEAIHAQTAALYGLQRGAVSASAHHAPPVRPEDMEFGPARQWLLSG